MFDAQFSMGKILKPFPGFEQRYEGKANGFPVAFPGTLDQQAGQNGYDPFLLGMLPVPLGSRVMIWIPAAIYNTDDTIQQESYTYQILWRMRSSGDYATTFSRTARNETTQYHFSKREIGVPDDPATPQTTQRIVLPAAMQTIAYEQPEPNTDPTVLANGVIHLRGQLVIPAGANWIAPLLPPPLPDAPTQGIIGQGVFPFTQGPEEAEAGGPVYHPFWFDAEGDEMMIIARRTEITPENWEFGGTDLPFSATYGTANGTRPLNNHVGIFVFTGSAP